MTVADKSNQPVLFYSELHFSQNVTREDISRNNPLAATVTVEERPISSPNNSYEERLKSVIKEKIKSIVSELFDLLIKFSIYVNMQEKPEIIYEIRDLRDARDSSQGDLKELYRMALTAKLDEAYQMTATRDDDVIQKEIAHLIKIPVADLQRIIDRALLVNHQQAQRAMPN